MARKDWLTKGDRNTKIFSYEGKNKKEKKCHTQNQKPGGNMGGRGRPNKRMLC